MPTTTAERALDSARVRRAIVVVGQVQGVGFRPFVFGLATDLQLAGFARNALGAVHIEVEGGARAIDAFERRLATNAPTLARVDAVTSVAMSPIGEQRFVLEASVSNESHSVTFPPDTAPCDACLQELRDPADRRYRYPFLNCTQCGPRLTIVRGAPYDREATTMAAFRMCGDCRREYEDPSDRRFHAQPLACPACGPRLEVFDKTRRPLAGDPMEVAGRALRAGAVVAIKGVGGYHLACDATSEPAVRELRIRKHRDEKPFAVMVADLAGAERICDVTGESARFLSSPARPVVLMPKRQSAGVAPSVAPGLEQLGVMLPSTPLHYLLLETFCEGPLVMTSGNTSDEPIAFEDDDAFLRLASIADVFLSHNRSIHTRCDDSVVRAMGGSCVPLRRSRGIAPTSVRLANVLRRPTLATGGMLKATFALGEGPNAILSHHLGDLEHFDAYQAYVAAMAQYQDLFRVQAERWAHDLHPDYPSTHWAREHADLGSLVAVQHHHAHMASCLADNGIRGPAIGVVFDGGGYGLDGTHWGGEFFVGTCRNVTRVAHLTSLPLPGGDRAAREGWRVALSWLRSAGLSLGAMRARVPEAILSQTELVLGGRSNTPSTTSAGRLFDAVRWLVGGANRQTFEGQAAMELESLAHREPWSGAYPFVLLDDVSPTVVDTRPIVDAVMDDLANSVAASVVARRFHSTLGEMISRVCVQLRETTGVSDVTLSGGVFQNALLTEETCDRLRARGFVAYTHKKVPPNDGGLALGQMAVVAARDEEI